MVGGYHSRFIFPLPLKMRFPEGPPFFFPLPPVRRKHELKVFSSLSSPLLFRHFSFFSCASLGIRLCGSPFSLYPSSSMKCEDEKSPVIFPLFVRLFFLLFLFPLVKEEALFFSLFFFSKRKEGEDGEMISPLPPPFFSYSSASFSSLQAQANSDQEGPPSFLFFSPPFSQEKICSLFCPPSSSTLFLSLRLAHGAVICPFPFFPPAGSSPSSSSRKLPPSPFPDGGWRFFFFFFPLSPPIEGRGTKKRWSESFFSSPVVRWSAFPFPSPALNRNKTFPSLGRRKNRIFSSFFHACFPPFSPQQGRNTFPFFPFLLLLFSARDENHVGSPPPPLFFPIPKDPLLLPLVGLIQSHAIPIPFFFPPSFSLHVFFFSLFYPQKGRLAFFPPPNSCRDSGGKLFFFRLFTNIQKAAIFFFSPPLSPSTVEVEICAAIIFFPPFFPFYSFLFFLPPPLMVSTSLLGGLFFFLFSSTFR